MADEAPELLSLLEELKQLSREQRNARLAAMAPPDRERFRLFVERRRGRAAAKATPNAYDQAVQPPPRVPPVDPNATAVTDLTQAPAPHATDASVDAATTIHPAGDAGALAALPRTIGGYRILSVLGRGGMGMVFTAEQQNPRRTVALKVIAPGQFNKRLLRRFKVEAEVLGRLEHPGIARIYEAGTADAGTGPQPFFAMELVRGVPLTEFADAQKLSVHQRLELLGKVCDAIQYAHEKQVIHRDLKPGNILVTPDGNPKVLDFGVARATDADLHSTTLETNVGQLIGTLPYMSPEQAGGNPDELDTRSDVYALGVIAYQLLVGRLPYEMADRMVHEAVRIIREDEPAPLSSVNKTMSGDVQTIVSKALMKEKARRYQSAAELASDLRNYVADRPIAARPISAQYRAERFRARNRNLIDAIEAVVIGSGFGAAAGYFGFITTGPSLTSLSPARTAFMPCISVAMIATLLGLSLWLVGASAGMRKRAWMLPAASLGAGLLGSGLIPLFEWTTSNVFHVFWIPSIEWAPLLAKLPILGGCTLAFVACGNELGRSGRPRRIVGQLIGLALGIGFCATTLFVSNLYGFNFVLDETNKAILAMAESAAFFIAFDVVGWFYFMPGQSAPLEARREGVLLRFPFARSLLALAAGAIPALLMFNQALAAREQQSLVMAESADDAKQVDRLLTEHPSLLYNDDGEPHEPSTWSAALIDVYTKHGFRIGPKQLSSAVLQGDIAAVQLMVKSGVSISAADNVGQTPLQTACDGQSAEMVAWLLDHGADPNAAGNFTQTALQSVAKNGNVEMADLLIRHGANIDGKGSLDRTPLDLAYSVGKTIMATWLIAHGAHAGTGH